jgi:predicted nucleotidyltransferase
MIKNPIEKLKEFFDRDSNIVFAVVFGSFASGRQRIGSDIDVGIYFANPPEGLELLNLINTLSELAGMNVDIVVLNRASAFLRHQAMKHRITLIIKDMAVYRDFRDMTISDYDEYKYISGMNVYDR